MNQNRNKLIDLFIGNMSNCAVHQILEKAIEEESIRDHYNKELLLSLDIAKRYREKINPKNKALPTKDIERIRKRVMRRVNTELNLRISKGYENINLEDVEVIVDKLLKNTKVS